MTFVNWTQFFFFLHFLLSFEFLSFYLRNISIIYIHCECFQLLVKDRTQYLVIYADDESNSGNEKHTAKEKGMKKGKQSTTTLMIAKKIQKQKRCAAYESFYYNYEHYM